MTDLARFFDEDQRRFVDERIRAGEYPDAAALLRAAVGRLEAAQGQQESQDHAFEEAYGAAVQVGIDELEAGSGIEVTDVTTWLAGLRRKASEAA